jgi:hypothetical protein
MADLIYQRDVSLQFSDLDFRTPLRWPVRKRTRYAGLHVSGILGAIAERVGWLKAEVEREERSGQAVYPWVMAMGVMWEEFFFSLPWAREAGTVWQPGERIWWPDNMPGRVSARMHAAGNSLPGGIAANCDAITPWDDDAQDCVLEETKFTSLRARDWEELRADKRQWEHQVRDYSFLYGPRVTRQSVMYYMGDRKGSGPICRQYMARWTDREVADSWRMTLNHREYAKAEEPAGNAVTR